MNSNDRRGQLIAIASGKGGVGKTWLAITLAHALARSGRKVLLFDGDLGLANVDIQLGLLPDRDLGTMLRDGLDPADACLHYAPGDFSILAGRSGSAALAALSPETLENLLAGLRQAAARFDIVLLDLGAGIDRSVRRMAVAADRLLVVATDEPTSLTDAYAVLKLHDSDRGGAARRESDRSGASHRQIVINQAVTQAAGQRTYATLARACTSFLGSAPPLAAIIRRDERVRDAIRRQMLLLIRSPLSPAAIDVEALARALSSHSVRPPVSAPA